MKNNKGQFAKGCSNPNKILPIIGTKFGSLEVISEDQKYRSDGKSIWLLQCICTEKQWITSKDLRRTVKPRVMCSKCSRSLAGKLRMLNSNLHKKIGSHSGAGDLTLTHLCHWKAGAKKRNLEWNLDVNYLWDLFLQNDKKCTLSGVPIELGELKDSKVNYAELTASLDRIDSSRGYEKGNVQWVHKHINIMKNKYDQQYFIDMCKAVANTTIMS